MAYKVFIDGEAGTTGLQIRERLVARDDITLVQVDHERRKDAGARSEAMAEADVAILCLPDDAAREAVELAKPYGTRLIDPSTAHRVHPDWVFGFAELTPEHRDRIKSAQYVSNPGCYSSGAIALLKPLVQRGLIAADAPISINAISGYTGGGNALIAEYKNCTAPAAFVYGLTHQHKHLPEIAERSGLTARPIFIPQVGNYAQGMIVQVPLHLPAGNAAELEEGLRDHYAGQQFVKVVDAAGLGARLDPERLNGTNMMELSVHASEDGTRVVLVATLDNLGKGASGSAVQNLNLMMGADEAAGL